MNNIKNILKNIFSAIGEKSSSNDLFLIITILMCMMLVSIFGFVFMGIWYIIPTCLSYILLFQILYTIFSFTTSIVLSIMTIVGFIAWIDEKEKK
jgi:hypothetical protein